MQLAAQHRVVHLCEGRTQLAVVSPFLPKSQERGRKSEKATVMRGKLTKMCLQDAEEMNLPIFFAFWMPCLLSNS